MVRPSRPALTPSGRAVLALMTVAVVAVAGLLPAATSPLRASEAIRPTPQGRVLAVSPDQASRSVTGRPAGVTDDRAEGLVYGGLTDSPRCPGGFAVDDAGTGVVCTHGPDGVHDDHADGHNGADAVSGVDAVDVQARRTTAQLFQAAGTTPAAAAAAASGAVPCYGDGTSGSRVQAVYAVAADQVDRYETVAPLIQSTYAARADAVYNRSAAREGGVRHIRWVTDAGCAVDVLHVVLSSTGDDSFGNTRSELIALGLKAADRKYLIWVDATVYCGIANVTVDDRAGTVNAANRGPTFGRVDSGCWGLTNAVEAHELAHTLGAVQLGAPDSNGSWHCTDESDRMCYDDGSGAKLTFPCPSTQEAVFDCSRNDYFSLSPEAGSWLATHWNLADSVFLATAEPEVTATPTVVPTESPSATASPSPTGSPTPTPTVTTGGNGHRHHRVVTGRLTRSHHQRTFWVRADQGRLEVAVHFRQAPRLHLRVERAAGKVIGHRFAHSVLVMDRHVRHDGTFRVVVRGAPTHFRLRLTFHR